MSWPAASLGEVCEVVSGATPRTEEKQFWDGGIPWTTPKDISALETPYLERTPRTISEAGLKSCAAKLLPPESVLLSSRAPIGLVAINKFPVATNQGFKSLVPEPRKLDSKFLFHWLKSRTDYLQSLGNGATFKEISKAVVERIEIPLPPLDEQRRIAAILDKADALRRKRKRSLELLDGLTQSIFLEMFGSRDEWLSSSMQVSLFEIANPKQWKTISASELLPEGYPVYGANGVIGFFNEFNHERPTVLITCRGATCGTINVCGENSYVTGNAMALDDLDTDRVTLEYLEAALRVRGVNDAITGTAQPQITRQSLSAVTIPVPSLDVQRRYAALSNAVSDQLPTLQNSTAEIENLFASLQHRAFSGQL